MSQHYNHAAFFNCLNVWTKTTNPFLVGVLTQMGLAFIPVEATCNYGLACPPYNNYKELNCMMCTK